MNFIIIAVGEITTGPYYFHNNFIIIDYNQNITIKTDFNPNTIINSYFNDYYSTKIHCNFDPIIPINYIDFIIPNIITITIFIPI